MPVPSPPGRLVVPGSRVQTDTKSFWVIAGKRQGDRRMSQTRGLLKVDEGVVVVEGVHLTAYVSPLPRPVGEDTTAKPNLLSRFRRNTTLRLESTLSEMAMWRVRDNAPVGLVEVDRAGRILWSNPRARTILGLEDGAPVYGDGRDDKGMVVSIQDTCATESYVGILRKLARGELVNDVHCSLRRPDGRKLKIAIDAASQLSEEGRVDRIVYAMHETKGRGDAGADMDESSGGLSAALRGVEHKRAPESVMTARELEEGVGQPLTAAWLELDACRAALGNTDHPAMLGRLELIVSLLREAVFNLLSTTAKYPSAALDGAVVERTRRDDFRSGSVNRCLHPWPAVPGLANSAPRSLR